MADTNLQVGSKRSFLFIFLVSLFTLGLYWLYWFYKTNCEIKDYGKLNFSPVMRLVGLIIFGWLLIPAVYVIYLWLKDIHEVAKKHSLGAPSPLLNSLLFFIVPFWGLYVTYKAQATLNNIWDAAQKQENVEEKAEQQKIEVQPIEKVFMKCPRCKTRNPEENNFCRKCGEKLAD